MKNWTLHFLMAIFIFPGSACAFELYRAGARSAALGNSGAAFTGAESLFHNPAGLTGADQLSFIVSSESRFLMKELSVLAAGLVIPSKAGSAGVSFTRFRAGVYRNSRTAVAYARKLGDRVSAAVAFDYLSEWFPENDRPFSALTAETGIQVRCSEKWLAGLWVFNPASIKKDDPQGLQTLPSLIRCGSSWQPKKELILYNELEFRSDKTVSVAAGLEITPHPLILIRAGLSSMPLNLSGGVGFRLGRTAIDISFYHHGYFGFTPVAGFTFNP